MPHIAPAIVSKSSVKASWHVCGRQQCRIFFSHPERRSIVQASHLGVRLAESSAFFVAIRDSEASEDNQVISSSACPTAACNAVPEKENKESHFSYGISARVSPILTSYLELLQDMRSSSSGKACRRSSSGWVCVILLHKRAQSKGAKRASSPKISRRVPGRMQKHYDTMKVKHRARAQPGACVWLIAMRF